MDKTRVSNHRNRALAARQRWVAVDPKFRKVETHMFRACSTLRFKGQVDKWVWNLYKMLCE
jgi:hypothetical protein